MHVWYVDAGIEDTPEPVYTHCLVLSCLEWSLHQLTVFLHKRVDREELSEWLFDDFEQYLMVPKCPDISALVPVRHFGTITVVPKCLRSEVS